ncbi:methionyl-tRNA formyltransferase [Rhizobiaceae bacterium n13]|uniref:Methionyl-tRNA formyltransferase n=1 Tax=Ferirhizobium litorale TaxID=2927786 RepID=A0AAE3U347_9HYPH|nr:formyltransferase family protein [Fererhizobium litorale]MDI7864807.1 methionyl-tRNA formyltransferase [Fererhizobium litorale]MDI7921719.1 methionyl-tRNA formyltransferase [Fererhizobium litorale]
MRIVLVGALESTRVAMGTLIASGMPPVALLTLPPETLARHADSIDLGPLARENFIGVHYTNNVNSNETLHILSGIEPDLVLVVGWSQMCGPTFRAVARIGTAGFHPSALPKMRGRAVIPWTILTHQSETGSTLFWLGDDVDNGDIIVQHSFAVAEDETARSLYDRHMQQLRAMIPEAVAAIRSGSPPRTPQDHSQATYCARRSAIDGMIDWQRPAEDILTLVRAVGDPYLGAFTHSGGATYFIDVAFPFADSHRYIGMTGQVQAHTDQGFVVRCGDGECVEVTSWRSEDGSRPRRHDLLGQGQ